MDEKIVIEDVCQEKGVKILDNISTRIYDGEIFSIFGPSGSGKTTLLRLINRLDEKTSGRIYLDGTNVNDLDVITLRRRVGMVFQLPALLPGKVYQNVLFGPGLFDETKKEDRGLALRYLKLVGLNEGFLDRDGETLSVGQQQRVSIARTLANEPEVILMDEPTSALDPTATLKIEELIKRLNRKLKVTIVIVTHNIEQAVRISDRSMLIVKGKKIEEGKTKAMLESPEEELTGKFISGHLEERGAEEGMEEVEK